MKNNEEIFNYRLERIKYLDKSKLVGCDKKELDSIEHKYDIILPKAYNCVLKKIGKNAGGIIDPNEFEFYYKDVLNLTQEVMKERAEIDDEEDGEPLMILPDKTFFISARYREQFHFIIADGGDDSEVYYYNFDDDSYVKDFDSIWDWIFSFIDSSKKTLDMLMGENNT